MVELTPASLAAVVVAPTVGLTALVVKMIARSGRIRLTWGTLARSKADLAAIAVHDAIGATLVVFAIVLFGISKPQLLVDAFQDDSLLAWGFIGVLGPMVSAVFVDRMPLRSVADVISRSGNGSTPRTAIEAAMTELRFRAVQRVLICLYEDVSVASGIERDRLMGRVEELLTGGVLGPALLSRAIEKFASENDLELPRHLAVQLRGRSELSEAEQATDAMKLAASAIDSDFERPVQIACRIAEDRVTNGV